jgi:hypothetical protein
MGLFGKRKDKIIDLTEEYNIQRRRPVNIQRKSQEIPKTSSETQSSGSGGFFGGFFGGNTEGQSSSGSGLETYEPERISYSQEGSQESALDAEEKRRRLAKRLQIITEKIEELSNQIYHLQQRIELVEKKLNIGSY